jgi:hypothetical protein
MKPSHDNSKAETIPATSSFVLPVHFAADFPVEFLIQRPVDVPLHLMRLEPEPFPAAQPPA